MAAAVTKKKTGNSNFSENEWSKTGTCMNRPDDGWAHESSKLERDHGVSYPVRYIGCMEIIVSMKTLDFDTRTAVARESICRVTQAAGIRNGNKRKKDKKLQKYLGDSSTLKNTGAEVMLNISTSNVSMVNIDTGITLLDHSMEEISFASGGDSETTDFIAYVAKDSQNNRACHVVECDGGSAANVIMTIAQAFEMRYKEMLKRKKQPVVVPDRQLNVHEESAWGDEEPTYYNEGAEFDELRRDEAKSQQPPPIPPLPDHYSARPTNLPISSEDTQSKHHPTSPLYENTVPGSRESSAYQEAQPVDNSPRDEAWFHGKLKRNDAERLLQMDGDFLVRESSNKEGQFVLSGMKNDIVVHLLLVDPEGVVRTKDRVFDNVSHLISYHKDNLVPILSQDIELYLTTPILRL